MMRLQQRDKIGDPASILMMLAILAVAAVALPSTLLADDFTERAKTVYLLGDYGMGTYKSQLMENNDTNSIVTYGIGAAAGQDMQLTVDYRVETATTTFALDGSSLLMKWDTTTIKYRLWAFELGAVIGSVAAKANKAGTDLFDCVGSGYGGYFGMQMPVGKRSSIDLKATQASTTETIDKKGRTVAIGPRLDVELSGRIALTKKNLDATVGYRRRTNSITSDRTAYSELQTATYLGFLMGFTF